MISNMDLNTSTIVGIVIATAKDSSSGLTIRMLSLKILMVLLNLYLSGRYLNSRKRD